MAVGLGHWKGTQEGAAAHLDLIILIVVLDLCEGLARHCLRQPSPFASMHLRTQQQNTWISTCHVRQTIPKLSVYMSACMPISNQLPQSLSLICECVSTLILG